MRFRLPSFFRRTSAGENAPPGHNRFAFSTSIFLRLLALTHGAAFLSLWPQLAGLIGPSGILPAEAYLRAAHEHLGASAYFRLPSLCWIFGADLFLHVLCATGVVAAVLLFLGIAPRLALVAVWLSYLSLVGVGQVFLGFQWDALLLETTLLAVFVAPGSLRPGWHAVEPPPAARFLLTWLIFRLMLLSGIVKLTSGDPTWRDLSALTFHFETQPLPNPLAWWVHQLPASVLHGACAIFLFLELVVPFFLFGPRVLRHIAALALAVLQLLIAVTGNFAFFNFLTLILCLLPLDDQFWHSLRRRAAPAVSPNATVVNVVRRRMSWALAFVVVLYTSFLSTPALNREWQHPAWFSRVASFVGSFSSLNHYGLFAVMTTSRPELIIEGSDDGREWQAYELPYKPGSLSRALPLVAPHQPRLDWQLWFAALGAPQHNPWVSSLATHLLRGTPEVVDLFEHNPFADRPPRYVRIVRYDYRFSARADRDRTGLLWRRTPLDYYLAPSALP